MSQRSRALGWAWWGLACVVVALWSWFTRFQHLNTENELSQGMLTVREVFSDRWTQQTCYRARVYVFEPRTSDLKREGYWRDPTKGGEEKLRKLRDLVDSSRAR